MPIGWHKHDAVWDYLRICLLKNNIMRNRYLRLTDVLLLFCFVAGTTMMACTGSLQQLALKSSYNETGKNWESEAHPTGQG